MEEAQDKLVEAKTKLVALRAQRTQLDQAIKDAEEDHRLADAHYWAMVRRQRRSDFENNTLGIGAGSVRVNEQCGS